MDWDCFKPAGWLTPMNEAPFYAVKASLGTDGAFGGVEIDENMQAKAAEGGVVPGLYVVGDLASGRFLNMAGIKKQILNDMSFAVSSGYVAGTHAAEQI
jgi:fumarate reductase flavoprotein subunit